MLIFLVPWEPIQGSKHEHITEDSMRRKILTDNQNAYEKHLRALLQAFPTFFEEIPIEDFCNMEKLERAQSALSKMLVLLYYKSAALGWCICDDEKQNNKLQDIFHALSNKINTKNIESDIDIAEIDNYANALISDEDITTLVSEMLLCDEDCDKLSRALTFFQQKDYYTCSFYLSTLIDSQNIKLEVEQHIKLQDDICPKQCWISFIRVLDYHFPNITDESLRNSDMSGPKKREAFTDLVDKINYSKYSVYETNILLIVAVGYCLINLFDNTNWMGYKNTRPAYFNRNWLTHGMYDIADVDRIDCLKLFFLLYGIHKLFGAIQPD